MTLCTESDYVIPVSSLRGTLNNCAMTLPVETGLRLSRGSLPQLFFDYNSGQFPKSFLPYPSHRMFRHMHGVLNAVEKITNYTV